jgi:hypothetical protein
MAITKASGYRKTRPSKSKRDMLPLQVQKQKESMISKLIYAETKKLKQYERKKKKPRCHTTF